MPLTQSALDFLEENRRRNSREWFSGHKGEFNSLLVTPLAELVCALSASMLEIDSRFVCEPKTGKCISRLYRDTRFTPDKTLFRDVMWILFLRDKKLFSGLPGFFFEISPRGYRYGCGFYQAGTDSMERIRSLILANHPLFAAALDSFESQRVFVIEGETYKKTHYADYSESLRQWLDRRNIYFTHNSTDFERLFSPLLAETLAADFRLLAPVYRFLTEAEALKQKKPSVR